MGNGLTPGVPLWITILPAVKSGPRFRTESGTQSADGIRWQKPDLGIHQVNGQDTNIVSLNTHCLGILMDPFEQNPSARYKIIFCLFHPGDDAANIVAAKSPDGIHWTMMEDKPVIGRHGARLDDVIILDYDHNLCPYLS